MKNCHSSDSFSLLPTSPKIFYGRESELADLVDTFASEPAQVAILRSGGMGKATLAMATLHHPTIVEKCTVKYFISRESANTHADLVTPIGLHLCLDIISAWTPLDGRPSRRLTTSCMTLSRQLSKAIVHHFVQCGSCLVVLDNLETPGSRWNRVARLKNFYSSWRISRASLYWWVECLSLLHR
jgi:hypothetical protein